MTNEDSPQQTPARTEGGRRPTDGSAGVSPAAPDPEVLAHPRRRNHTVRYKINIVEKVRILRKESYGAVGAFLRTEGLYYSNVKTWDRQYESGELLSMQRGPKAKSRQNLAEENKKLRRKIEQLEQRLAKTEMIVDLQKKLSSILDLESNNDSERHDAQ